MHHKLEISEDRKRITKYFEEQELLQLEALRSTEAYDICEGCDCLKVPRVTSTNDNSITFTYFPDATTYADLLIQDFEQAVELIPLIAKSLAYLQTNLKHSKKINFEYSQLTTNCAGAYAHGDFSVHNLLSQNDSLILVDWSSSKWAGKQFNHGPEHWDLIWFVLSLYLIPYINKLPFARRDLVADRLLNEYLNRCEFSHHTKLISFALSQNAHFFNYNRRTARWYSTIKHYPEWYRCRRFWKRALNERT